MGNARGRATVGRLPGPDLLQSSRLSLTSLTTYYIHTSSPVCIAHIHTFADLLRVRRLPATRRCLEIEQSHESTQHIEPSVRPRCPGSYLKRSAGDNEHTPSGTWYVRKEYAHATLTCCCRVEDRKRQVVEDDDDAMEL